MKVEQDLISLIFTEHGVCESWQKLPSTGVANEIYATEDVILRIATDHPDGICDARTESVAAPAAYRAGILTPRLLVFDDSRAIANSPYSMWERVKGETLGFLHDDLHDMNIMCTRDDELLALIDWGVTPVGEIPRRISSMCLFQFFHRCLRPIGKLHRTTLAVIRR